MISIWFDRENGILRNEVPFDLHFEENKFQVFFLLHFAWCQSIQIIQKLDKLEWIKNLQENELDLHVFVDFLRKYFIFGQSNWFGIFTFQG